jgi:ubiquinone/menaquinone biosynthesis C-methylase UbiE
VADPIDYDPLAAAYDGRYVLHEYAGVHDTLIPFAVGAAPSTLDVLEVGCGTGHWLAALAGRTHTLAGVDASRGMLDRARAAAPDALLVQGCAEILPWRSFSFDRVVVIKALHHFTDAAKFVREARRVLRPSGGVLITLIRKFLGATERSAPLTAGAARG